jgi:hypothetical protein
MSQLKQNDMQQHAGRFSMERKISILVHLLILLALSACRITSPSPTATTLPSRQPDPVVDS